MIATMKFQLIFPMVAYVFYIGGLNLYLMKTRFKAVLSKKLSRAYYKSFNTGEVQPENVAVAGRHLDNQYQVPMLFLFACATHISIGLADGVTLSLAWLFVATRLLHSFIHLGENHIYKRIGAFAAGWLMVMGLWGQLAYFALLSL